MLYMPTGVYLSVITWWPVYVGLEVNEVIDIGFIGSAMGKNTENEWMAE